MRIREVFEAYVPTEALVSVPRTSYEWISNWSTSGAIKVGC